MRIAIGSDHAGLPLKTNLVEFLRAEGHDPLDLGTHDSASVDYPDYAEAVGCAVREGRAERGVMICGSGVGGAIAANKIPGVRAGLCHDMYSAHQGVEHDDMNVLVLGSLVIGQNLARDLLGTFLQAEYQPVERYARRLEKVNALERRYASPTEADDSR